MTLNLPTAQERAKNIFGVVIENLSGGYIKRNALGTIESNNNEAIKSIATALTAHAEAAVKELSCPSCNQNVAFCPSCQKAIRCEAERRTWEKAEKIAHKHLLSSVQSNPTKWPPIDALVYEFRRRAQEGR